MSSRYLVLKGAQLQQDSICEDFKEIEEKFQTITILRFRTISLHLK